jgi:4-hydroxy-tetrahydrodipicolinate synthase
MKTTPVTPADLIASVLALPPIARLPDGRINKAESSRIVDWLAAGGITTFCYGGIANFFNVRVSEYPALLDLIETIAPSDAWVIPTIGPDFGKAMDQIAILRERDFPTAMLLPFSPVMPAGVASGLRRMADAFGRPLMLFFQSADYLKPNDLAALVSDGVVCTIEFGVHGTGPNENPFLAELLDLVGDASHIIDARGEPSIVSTARFGLKGFTSGMSVIAPRISTAILAAVKSGDLEAAAVLREHFVPLGLLRAAHSFVAVLQAAVGLVGIAEAGPIGPFYADIADPAILREIQQVSTTLKMADAALA